MMSDKCAPALDVSVEEQDSFGSFGEDSVQTLLSRRATEVAIAVKSLNRMRALGHAKFVRVA